MLLVACGTGLSRDPVVPPSPTPLSGTWARCASLGTGGPEHVALSGDETTVAFLFRQGQVAVHRVADQALLIEIPNTLSPFPAGLDIVTPPAGGDVDYFFENHAIALSRDGSLVAVEDQWHTAIWRVSDGTLVIDLPIGFAPPGTLQFDDAGDALLLGGHEVRRVQDGTLIHDYSDVDAWSNVAFVGNGSEVVAYKGAILTFDVDPVGSLVGTVNPSDGVTSLDRSTFSPHGRYLAGFVTTAATDPGGVHTDLRVYDSAGGDLLWTVSKVVSGTITFSPDDRALFVYGYADTSVPQWVLDLATGDVRQTASEPTSYDVALGAGGTLLFVTTLSGAYWTPDQFGDHNDMRFATLPGQALSFRTAVASPDGRWLATASVAGVDNDVILWNVADRAGARAIFSVDAQSLEFSQDSQRLLICAGESIAPQLQEWPLNADRPSWTMAPPDGVVLAAAAYSPSRSNMIAASSAGVSIVDVAGSFARPSIAVGWPAPAFAFSPREGGATIATSGPALWRVSDRQRLWPALEPTIDPMPSQDWMMFSPDGNTILLSKVVATGQPPLNGRADGAAGANYTSTTSLYRSADGSLIQTLGDADVPMLPRDPAFSPDGAWIVAGNQVWNVESGGPGQRLLMFPRYKNPSVSTFLSNGTIAVAREDGIIELFCPQ